MLSCSGFLQGKYRDGKLWVFVCVHVCASMCTSVLGREQSARYTDCPGMKKEKFIISVVVNLVLLSCEDGHGHVDGAWREAVGGGGPLVRSRVSYSSIANLLVESKQFLKDVPGKYATVDDFRPESLRLEIFQLIRSRWATAWEQFAFGVYWNAKFLGKYLSGLFFSQENGPIARNLHHLAVESSLYIDIKDNYQLGNWESFFPSF